MMQKLMVFVRRKAGTTSEAFRAHYEAMHAPLAMANMTGLLRYVRNYPHAMPGQPVPQYDCVTEMWFESSEALAATMAWMRSDEGKTLAADEELFMDRSSMTAFRVDEIAS
tara:strand:+ start:340 stop:672 length:333 start_codon:yes stop_codon:yes gene_type:complete